MWASVADVRVHVPPWGRGCLNVGSRAGPTYATCAFGTASLSQDVSDAGVTITCNLPGVAGSQARREDIVCACVEVVALMGASARESPLTPDELKAVMAPVMAVLLSTATPERVDKLFHEGYIANRGQLLLEAPVGAAPPGEPAATAYDTARGGTLTVEGASGAVEAAGGTGADATTQAGRFGCAAPDGDQPPAYEGHVGGPVAGGVGEVSAAGAVDGHGVGHGSVVDGENSADMTGGGDENCPDVAGPVRVAGSTLSGKGTEAAEPLAHRRA